MSFMCLIVLFIAHSLYAQKKKARVLFIGNSYTYANGLPKLVADVAASTGDTLEYDMSAPGGATLNRHYVFVAETRAKIQAGGWDYVVLQEQSQVPATAPAYFDTWVYPFAKYLVDEIRLFNACAEVIFYMTWGRKNGDRSMCHVPINWTHFCTYRKMDSVLRSRYIIMADSNKATLSPVGAVWRYIRSMHPGIELYDADESHPSPAGSYAAACSFYTAIFKKPATLITQHFAFSLEDAINIKTAATRVVYDSLHFWHIGQYETIAGFSHQLDRMLRADFTNRSANATHYQWDFGDGQTSIVANPTHVYERPGVYLARLIATGTSCSDTTYARIVVGHEPNGEQFTVAPNPATDRVYITSELFTQHHFRIQLVNSVGQVVYERQASGAHTQSVDVVGLPRGIYVLHISTTKMVYRKKIMVR